MIFEEQFKIPGTITDTIYEFLKKSIIEGTLKPTQKLQEKEIASLFEVSSTPVREAFQRLYAEGFIVIKARRDVIVAPTSIEDVKGLFEVVRVLDALASKKAIKRLTNKEVKNLEEMTNQLANLYYQKKVIEYVKLNLEIHKSIWKSCGNNFLYQFLVNLVDKYTFYSNQFFFLTDDEKKRAYLMQRSFEDHLNLVKAIKEKNTSKVEKIILSHWGQEFLEDEN